MANLHCGVKILLGAEMANDVHSGDMGEGRAVVNESVSIVNKIVEYYCRDTH